MSTPQPFFTTPDGPQRVEDALALIAPKWTTWTVQTLAQHDGPLRVGEILDRLPFLTQPLLSARLARMLTDTLVERSGEGRYPPYRLSPLGAALAPVHQALADWSHAHLDVGQVARAARIEDALRRLHLRHTTTFIQALSAGPQRYTDLVDRTALAAHTHPRLVRLHLEGLITRTGPSPRDPYTLTPAGAALRPVYTALTRWTAHAPTPHHRPASRYTAATNPLPRSSSPGDTGRTTAALRRSPLVPGTLFSHAPQPPTPPAVTTPDEPARAR